MQIVNGRPMKHPCGIYPQGIPKDPASKLSAVPHRDAEALGFMKVDFLHNSVYNKIESRDQLDELIDKDPPWDLLKSRKIVSQLFQISKHYELTNRLKPKSIVQLADLIALIRPGKSYLTELYLSNPEKIRPLLYEKEDDGFIFKKSHAHSYALVIVLQLHLISSGIDFP